METNAFVYLVTQNIFIDSGQLYLTERKTHSIGTSVVSVIKKPNPQKTMQEIRSVQNPGMCWGNLRDGETISSMADEGRFHGRAIHHGLEGWTRSKSEGDRMDGWVDGQEAQRQGIQG